MPDHRRRNDPTVNQQVRATDELVDAVTVLNQRIAELVDEIQTQRLTQPKLSLFEEVFGRKG